MKNTKYPVVCECNEVSKTQIVEGNLTKEMFYELFYPWTNDRELRLFLEKRNYSLELPEDKTKWPEKYKEGHKLKNEFLCEFVFGDDDEHIIRKPRNDLFLSGMMADYDGDEINVFVKDTNEKNRNIAKLKAFEKEKKYGKRNIESKLVICQNRTIITGDPISYKDLLSYKNDNILKVKIFFRNINDKDIVDALEKSNDNIDQTVTYLINKGFS